ncbi:MAG: hydrogenase 3 maturation endopeptidase HyCI [Elusimicrobia bacterium]|jgi:hydrogenase maturation protease|nr:hydrogenase 3 maturation endopeptidase HyCI [Elusimicrobiota bacterium]
MDTDRLKRAGRIVVMGVGNPDRGDDAVGAYVAEILINAGYSNVFNCLSVPENYLVKVNALNPDTIIIADAVNMNESPGFFKLIEPEKIQQGITTHNAGLDMIAEFLRMSGKAEILILAIQPETVSGAASMGPAVKKAADEIIERLKEVI